MKVLKLSTQLHKWIALVVGLQVLFWVGGGLVMTAIPIETVRGEHRAVELMPDALELGALPALGEIARRAGVAPVQAELHTTPRGAAWTLKPAAGEPVVVSAATGRPLTAWKSQTQPLLAPESWTGLVIEPDRQVLYADCDRRADLMVENGALDEVRRLVARDLSPALPAMKAVGVRELAACVSGALDREAAVAALKQATRNYAKRQLTWFRNQCRDWSRIPRP